ncbi:hypothetical protein ACGF5C_27040 [Micromonospora sp. NPDC047620]|uniref:hypothetical protein n=1 Tax=Micromonospora sp. NPDC047620 TaxID=3364251 RepID=UPI00372180D3
MMRTGAYTGVFRDQHSATLTDALNAAAAAAAAGNLTRAFTQAHRATDEAGHLHRSVVRDALAAGLDWWAIGELLDMHPRAAFDTYANLADGTHAPAQQRPHLAVVCTAGLTAEHDMLSEHGIDLDDLDPQHSLTTDPTVVRLRAAEQLLGDDIWIAVKLPGVYDGDDDLDDDAAIRRWTTVALYPDELGWLREVLALNDRGPSRRGRRGRSGAAALIADRAGGRRPGQLRGHLEQLWQHGGVATWPRGFVGLTATIRRRQRARPLLVRTARTRRRPPAPARPRRPRARRNAGALSSGRHYEQPERQGLGRKLLQTAG